MTIPIRLFGVPIGQASLAFLSEQSEPNEQKKFVKLLRRSLHQVSFFALPTSVLLLILRIPIVRLVFGAHNLPWKTTVTTAKVVAILALSVTAQALVQLLIRAFHARKNTKTPLVLRAISVAVYLSLSVWLVFGLNWGVMGIGIATSVSAIIEVSLFLFVLHRQLSSPLLTNDFFVPQIKMLVAGFCMAVFLYLPFRILDELIFDTSRTIELIGLTVTTSTIGILVYLYFSALLEIKELNLVTRLLSSALKWQKPLSKSTEVLTQNTGNETAI